MKTFVALIMLSKISLACTVMSGFNFATLDEQIRYAGAILVGTVTNVSDPINQAVVSFSNVDFYRGCVEGRSINVGNFRSSAACGPGIPQVGDRIIIFACDYSGSNASLEVNQYVPFAGWVQATQQNLQTVQNATMNSPQRCNFGKRVDQCYNRETASGRGGVYAAGGAYNSSSSMSSSQSEDLLDKLDRKRDEYRQSYDRRRVEYRDRINRNVNRALTPSSDRNIIYRS